MKTAGPRGRPRTCSPERAEQLRLAKRAQRERERGRGLAAVELRLPAREAQRLRVAVAGPRFREALRGFLDGAVVDIDAWPALKELAWNRKGRFIAAEDAFAIYERNWRFVDPKALGPGERELIERLKERHGGGVFNG